MIAGFGDQLRWAADLAPVALEPTELVVVAGMGGSGISGDFAAALADVPVMVNKNYGLPSWVASARPLVVAMSYSGNTEETLAAATAAVTSVAAVASALELAVTAVWEVAEAAMERAVR